MLNFVGYMIAALPLAILAFFVSSLVCYIIARKKQKKDAGALTDAEIRNKRLALIISSILFALLIVIVVALVILLELSIRYM